MESLEQIQGMPPGMYHRYGVLDDDMEDDDDDNADHAGDFSDAAGGAVGMYSANMLVAGMASLGVHDTAAAASDAADAAGVAAGEGDEAGTSGGAAGQGNWSLLAHPGELSSSCVHAMLTTLQQTLHEAYACPAVDAAAAAATGKKIWYITWHCC
jgi:hypothetical protein